RVLEVKEVARVVPDEAVSLDGLAPAADLAVGLEDEVVGVAALRERRGGGQAGDAGADDESANGVHDRLSSSTRVPSAHSRRAARARVAPQVFDHRTRLAEARPGARDGRVFAG